MRDMFELRVIMTYVWIVRDRILESSGLRMRIVDTVIRHSSMEDLSKSRITRTARVVRSIVSLQYEKFTSVLFFEKEECQITRDLLFIGILRRELDNDVHW